MSRGLIFFLATLGIIATLVVATLIVARSNDGPMEVFAGGPFETGEFVGNVTDWSFVDEHMTIQLQTMDPARSRTMWIAVVDNRLFLITSFMKSKVGRVWKKWPHKVAEDPSAVIRVDGKRYRMKLTRIDPSDDFVSTILARFNTKYKREYEIEQVRRGGSWLFELTPT